MSGVNSQLNIHIYEIYLVQTDFNHTAEWIENELSNFELFKTQQVLMENLSSRFNIIRDEYGCE